MLRKVFILLYLPCLILLGACGVPDTLAPATDDASNTDDAASTGDTQVDETDFNDNSIDTTGTDGTDSSPATDAASPSGSVDQAAPAPQSVCPDWSTNPFPASALELGTNLSATYEPSGAVWHDTRGTLFVVSDEGILTEMLTDGTILNNWTLGGDLEGVTVVPSLPDYVYLGFENPDSVAEFNLVTGLVTRTFMLTSWMTGTANLGLEAITFVADAALPNGGEFWAGHQGEGRIYIFDLPIVTSRTSTVVSFQTSFQPVSGRTDIADLNYDAENDAVLVLYDAANKLRILDADGNYLYEWTVPGNDQEGIALLPDCSLMIAEDAIDHSVLNYAR